MSATLQPAGPELFRYTRTQLGVAALAALAFLLLFQNTLLYLYDVWHREEYSHGFLVPFISAFLLWQRRAQLRSVEFHSSWAGVVVVALGIAIYFLGTVASITTVDTYALVIVLMGATLALMGWQAFRIALVPLALLFLMNPIPNFFYYNLSAQLQLLSSELGVAFMRLCGVSVLLEGNVIDLGSYQLQVAEACSGLRYLFPLMTLGVIVAYLFRGRAWMRWLLFVSTVPITIFMNGLRIGIIGVLVDRYGIAQAEGFVHQFEGWVIFMACLALLLAEAWLLLRLTGDRRSFRDALSLEVPPPRATAARVHIRSLGVPVLIVLAILLLSVVPARALPRRIEERPPRADFVSFPMQVGDWHGRRGRLEPVYLDTLKMDDYILADFIDGLPAQGGVPAAAAAAPVNFYAAYYASQRTGQSAHSPRSCLPGGGWRITEFSDYTVPGAQQAGMPLRVNRVIVQQGSARQLVYYWFQERGRNITNEYQVKWYLLRDALVRNRTDGALVRLVTPLGAAEEAARGDQRLGQFAHDILPALHDYLPN
jgi:exosortase D (VPLPA-CTERM-specific)